MHLTLALATGMSVNNARGVIEAILNRQSEFTRTPKYGSETIKGGVRRVRYMPIKSFLPAIEILFALYFGYCTWHAISQERWLSVPFLAMFLGGFAYVASKSITFWIQQMGVFAPSSRPAV